jgi:hypothetical protein
MKKNKAIFFTFVLLFTVLFGRSYVFASSPAAQIKPINAQFIYINNTFTAGWTNETPALLKINPAQTYDGSNTITMTFQKPWDEITIQNKYGIDVSSYQGLLLMVSGDKGGEKINVVFYGPDGSRLGSANVNDFVPNYQIGTSFTQSYIPFRFVKLKSNIISKILFTSGEPAKIYVGRMLFSEDPLTVSSSLYVGAGGVFDGDTQNAWYLNSWDAQTNIVSSGNSDAALQGNFTEPGGGIYFKNLLGMNSYSYHHLVFSIKGNALYQNISLAIYDPNNNLLGSVWLNNYLQSSDYADYQTVSIPLSDLNAENRIIGNITLGSPTATQDFYINNLQFKF